MRELLDQLIIGTSCGIRDVKREIERFAVFPGRAILVLGETGTGKDLVAEGILRCSGGRLSHVEVFNCPAVPEDHLESDLFGTRRGAFPGAVDRAGVAPRASGGILFLDEISSMSLRHQAKILRLLENRSARALGGTASYEVDALVVASSCADLRERVAKGEFRADLYYRLVQDGVLEMPPLRERTEDVELLAAHFMREIPPALTLDSHALAVMASYSWPGNVRQLRAVVRSAGRSTCRGHIGAREVRAAIRLTDVGGEPSAAHTEPSNSKAAFADCSTAMKREMLRRALVSAGGNKTLAGCLLEFHRGRKGSGDALDPRSRKLAQRKFEYWWRKLAVGSEHLCHSARRTQSGPVDRGQTYSNRDIASQAASGARFGCGDLVES